MLQLSFFMQQQPQYIAVAFASIVRCKAIIHMVAIPSGTCRYIPKDPVNSKNFDDQKDTHQTSAANSMEYPNNYRFIRWHLRCEDQEHIIITHGLLDLTTAPKALSCRLLLFFSSWDLRISISGSQGNILLLLKKVPIDGKYSTYTDDASPSKAKNPATKSPQEDSVADDAMRVEPPHGKVWRPRLAYTGSKGFQCGLSPF